MGGWLSGWLGGWVVMWVGGWVGVINYMDELMYEWIVEQVFVVEI